MRTDRSLREGAKRHQARGLKRPKMRTYVANAPRMTEVAL